ncbi:DUF397 domain-containing protein [Streptomyces sp. SID3343]|uniref:DUF397 domain-containing protein n=1 Tax=Streptomyces sp. SID3343 TaxID=2690260 RepID=UPI001370376A|nr:DUF397 domain-containing protein [Streptomyces sp. SID3343]MYW06404.1 DUF397 domain-containing protein [Streptomyces sp. SID3343]
MSQKADLYAQDLSEAVWLAAPGSPVEDRIEIAELGDGAMALRNPADPLGAIQRYTAEEWQAFIRGVQDGEFDR